MRSTIFLASIVASAVLSPAFQVKNELVVFTGPAHGSLVLMGGGMTQVDISKRFVELGGGAQCRLVVIPSAIDSARLTPEGLERLKSNAPGMFHLQEAVILHARSRAEADSTEFVKPIETATAVWILGGDADKLADLYVGTRTEKAIASVTERGGVVGGTSAGALILSQFVSHVTADTPAQYARKFTGFGFFRNTTLAPHWTARDATRRKILIAFNAHPEALGIAIDESTAAVVTGSKLEVVGNGAVGLYDGKQYDGQPYLLIPAGKSIDMNTITLPVARAKMAEEK
jgi:cyanophycinase